MTHWRYGTIALLLVAVESPMAFADWDVQDSIAGIIIHISWPLQPENAYIRTQHLLQSRSLVLLSRRLAAMNTVDSVGLKILVPGALGTTY